MAKWGNCDFKELQELQKRMEKLAKQDYEAFCIEVAKELAARFLAKVIKITPKRKPEDCPPGVKGGTLQRGWTINNKKFDVVKKGNVYEVMLTNPTEYASYVEFGHRTRGGKGFVQGQFFMTISENEIRREAPAIIDRKLKALLGEVF